MSITRQHRELKRWTTRTPPTYVHYKTTQRTKQVNNKNAINFTKQSSILVNITYRSERQCDPNFWTLFDDKKFGIFFSAKFNFTRNSRVLPYCQYFKWPADVANIDTSVALIRVFKNVVWKSQIANGKCSMESCQLL